MMKFSFLDQYSHYKTSKTCLEKYYFYYFAGHQLDVLLQITFHRWFLRLVLLVLPNSWERHHLQLLGTNLIQILQTQSQSKLIINWKFAFPEVNCYMCFEYSLGFNVIFAQILLRATIKERKMFWTTLKELTIKVILKHWIPKLK